MLSKMLQNSFEIKFVGIFDNTLRGQIGLFRIFVIFVVSLVIHNIRSARTIGL